MTKNVVFFFVLLSIFLFLLLLRITRVMDKNRRPEVGGGRGEKRLSFSFVFLRIRISITRRFQSREINRSLTKNVVLLPLLGDNFVFVSRVRDGREGDRFTAKII